ncbi:MAG: hypothetical protein WCL18_10665 [bacterium]
MDNDLLGQSLPPQKIKESRILTASELEKRQNIFGWELTTLLEQGTKKHIPQMNNKPRHEEPLTKEMEAQIKEIF